MYIVPMLFSLTWCRNYIFCKRAAKCLVSVQYLSCHLKPAVGNLFAIMDCMNCAISWLGCKINYFYPKILPLSNYEG